MLETHLGAPLFDRCHRAIRLDDRGRKHHNDTSRILDDIRAHRTPAPTSAPLPIGRHG